MFKYIISNILLLITLWEVISLVELFVDILSFFILRLQYLPEDALNKSWF